MIDYHGEAGARRFWAHVIDNIIVFVAVLVMILLVSKVTAHFIVAVGFGVITYFAYFIICEALWSRTPGKRMLGLIVVTLDGYTIGWREASLRGIMRLVEVNPLFFGNLIAGLAVVFSERKQRLGDMAAGTVVIRDGGEVDPDEDSDEFDSADDALRTARF